MSQLFHRRSNAVAQGCLPVLLLVLIAVSLVVNDECEPWYVQGKGYAPRQPVPFSHEHHVGGLGLDCRFCHGSVAASQFAGYPPTHTCMTCHSQVWTQADILAPVRQSYEDDVPIHWQRVYDLPDFVQFSHEIHVAKGVGCETCHGRVDRMPLIRQAQSLQMQWCLNCHRNPGKYVRPVDEVYTMGFRVPRRTPRERQAVIDELGIATEGLTDCSVCHY